ncbi:rve domain containing protein [Pyrenophora tritici-repentis]|nr:rve domain containing protein [Pyrenophora tritici-repentis]
MPSETSSAQSEEPVSILMAEPGQPAARDSYRQYLGKLEPHVHAPRFDGENISEFLDEYDFEADRVGWPEELRKKQLPYFCTQKSYQEYKEELRELYAGQDEFRQRGTRAFIENYVKEVQRRQPAVRIVEYYQNFVTYFAAAESRGQVAKLEKGHFFFRGLAIEDMERVMHHMPKDDRPRLDDVTSFKIEKIYQFVREHQAQEEGLSALYSDYSSTSRRLARRDAGVVEESIPTFKRPSEAPRQSVPGILPIAAQPDKAAAPKVDQAVEDLIQRFQGLSMTIEQFNEMAEGNIGIRRLFAKPENYAEAYKQLVLRPHRVSTEILERNDGSFKSIYPPIVNPQVGVHYAGNREPQRARCRCCGREGHIIANCPDQNLLKSNRWCHTRSEEQPNGWKQVRHLGHVPGGGIAPKPFGSEVLEWLLQSLKERFKVTDDQLKRPMQEVLPNWFDAAGRPIKVEKTGNSGESYTVESSEEAELMARQTMALRSAAQFLETVSCRVLHPEDDSEVNAIDGRTKAGRLAKEQREREARLGKKPGMPRMKSSRTASSYEDMDVEEEPEVLRHRAQVEIDDSQVPETQVQQRLDTPISNGTRERDSRSATVDYDVIPAPAPVPKASSLRTYLAAMAQNTAPTVLAKAMLNQEVRGIRQLDLLASPEVAAAVTKALEEARRPRVHFQVDETRSGETMEIQQANNNKSDDEKADSDEDGSIEEAVQRLYDWGSGDTCVVETESSQPEVITKGILTQLCPKMDRSRKIDRVGVGEANELHDFQNYEISDEEDGYVEAQSRMPSEARLKGELQQQRYSVKGQLPTCWVSLHGGMGRALIDTGSQLNVMRLSTARALNVYITELDQSGLPPELQQGMITADGGMDPFCRHSLFGSNCSWRDYSANALSDCETFTESNSSWDTMPVDIPREDAPMDLGRKDWKERAIARQAARIALRGPDIGPFDHLFYVRTATFPRGHRLNPERLRKMNIGEDLRPNEVHLIQQLMFQREDALAWEFQHMSQIHEDVQPPYKIRTIPHTAWQEKNFPLPKKLVPIVNAMVDWEFEIVHVPGKKNVIPDALSRYPQPEGWTPPKEDEDDLEPFIDRVLNRYEEINLVMATEETIGKLLTEEYDEKSEEIAVFLRTLKRPDGLRGQERRKWTKNAARFFKATKAMPVRRVVDGEDLQAALIQEIHERLGHKGIQTTFGAVCQRYWWDGMYRQVAKQLGPCKVCQTMRGTRKEAELNSTYSRAMWSWWTVDITHMPRVRGRTYLLVAREYLSGWPETRALSTASSDSVAKFIFEEICCRWGVPERISVDGGTENKSVVQSLATLFGIHRVQASAYNSRAQGLIERGHQGFIHGLAKMPGLWIDNLSAITWAERVSLRRPLGFSPAQLVLGQNPVLPIELVVPTWQSLPWSEVRSHADLLAVRATQLQFRRENLEEAVQRTRRLRREAVESRNAKKDVPKPFQVGDLVLVWDAIKSIDKSSDRKLDDRWRGPYRVREAQADKGYYRLEDLNEVAFPNTTRADRLKKFEELPEELEDSLLRGRLRLYPETERLPMAGLRRQDKGKRRQELTRQEMFRLGRTAKESKTGER